MGPWITAHAWWLAIVMLASGWPCMLWLGQHTASDREYARGYADAQKKLIDLARAGRERSAREAGIRRGPRHAVGTPRRAPAPPPAPVRAPWVIVPAPMPAPGAYPVIAKFPGSQPSGVTGTADTDTWRHDTGEFAAITDEIGAETERMLAAIRAGETL